MWVRAWRWRRLRRRGRMELRERGQRSELFLRLYVAATGRTILATPEAMQIQGYVGSAGFWIHGAQEMVRKAARAWLRSGATGGRRSWTFTKVDARLALMNARQAIKVWRKQQDRIQLAVMAKGMKRWMQGTAFW